MVDGNDRALVPFAPPAGAAPVRVVRAWVARSDAGLVLRWVVVAPPGAIVLPPAGGVPARRDRLWEHTCVEAFVAPAGGAGYWEVNVAPGGDWNVYRFDGYRSGMTSENAVRRLGAFACTGGAGEMAIAATVALPIGEAALDVGLAAVLRHADGTRSHWALRHVASQPDFHRRESFAVRLEAGA